jgi:hypothetical protein
MVRKKTTFRQLQVRRIVKGIKSSGVTGTFEFLLDQDLVRFHMTEAEQAAGAASSEKVNRWDEVLKSGSNKITAFKRQNIS